MQNSLKIGNICSSSVTGVKQNYNRADLFYMAPEVLLNEGFHFKTDVW